MKSVVMQIIKIADFEKSLPPAILFSKRVNVNDPKLYVTKDTILDLSYEDGLYDDFRVIDRRVVFATKGTGRTEDVYNIYVTAAANNDPCRRYVNFLDVADTK